MSAGSLRQKKYTDNLRRKGKCIRCRKKAQKNKCLCVACTIKQREYSRTRNGCKAWVKGKAGRPFKHKTPD